MSAPSIPLWGQVLALVILVSVIVAFVLLAIRARRKPPRWRRGRYDEEEEARNRLEFHRRHENE